MTKHSLILAGLLWAILTPTVAPANKRVSDDSSAELTANLNKAAQAVVVALAKDIETYKQTACDEQVTSGGLAEKELAIFVVYSSNCEKQGHADYLFLVKPANDKAWNIPTRVLIGQANEFTVQKVNFHGDTILIDGKKADGTYGQRTFTISSRRLDK